MTTIETIRTFTKSWIHPRTKQERLYINLKAFCEFIGLDVNFYNTGNVSSAFINGERISNSECRRIMSSADSSYFSVSNGKWYCNYGNSAILHINRKIAELEATQKPSSRELARRAMTRAHQIRREAAARLGCKASELCWSECLIMAWAEVKAA